MEITREVNNILVEAYEVAKKNRHEFVTAEHILYAITFQERFITVIEELEGNVEDLRNKLLDYLNNYIEKAAKQLENLQDNEFTAALKNFLELLENE